MNKRNAYLILIMLFSYGCSRTIDSVFDGLTVENRKIYKSKIECYSGSEKFYSFETTNRVWQIKGSYVIVEDDALITTNGDCIIYEYFKQVNQ